MSYDQANRMTAATVMGHGTEYYGYAPDNKRVYRMKADGTEELTLYGVRGEKLATFRLYDGATTTPTWAGVWFGGRLLNQQGKNPDLSARDRLGSVRATGSNVLQGTPAMVARFYPYGEEVGATTARDGAEFATYRRDGFSGFDYADQRMYVSSLGRFNTPDIVGNSGGPKNPNGWNRYAYVSGDPIGSNDPSGHVAILQQTCNGIDCVELGYIYCGTDSFTGEPYPWDPSCAVYGYQDPLEFDQGSVGSAGPTCEETEIAYVTAYLKKYNSPLAAFAADIVQDSQSQGLDDRFIVALSGVESTYGKNQNPKGSGQYNAFSNGVHCFALGVNAYCKAVDPYSSYQAAIADAAQTNGSGALYAGYSSTANIYSIYEQGSVAKTSPDQGILDQIYGKQLSGDLANVRKKRCP